MTNTSFLSITLAAATFTATTSFTAVPTNQRARSSALHLLPQQGSQLVAASNAALAQAQHDREHQSATATVKYEAKEDAELTVGRARELISRIFSLPSAIVRPSAMEITNVEFSSNENDDVVIYPVVGFRYVRVGDEYHALPTTSNAACQLRNLPGKQHESVFGWFSPACFLDRN